jgi:hypothetical protein
MNKMERKKKYKVTNVSNNERKFRDKFLGIDVLVKPGEYVLTDKAPERNQFWKIDVVEKLEEKKVKRRLRKNDSSSS